MIPAVDAQRKTIRKTMQNDWKKSFTRFFLQLRGGHRGWFRRARFSGVRPSRSLYIEKSHRVTYTPLLHQLVRHKLVQNARDHGLVRKSLGRG